MANEEYHHILPTFYLKRFWLPLGPNKNPQLFAYYPETKVWAPKGVRKFGGAHGFNSVTDLPGVDPRVVENVYQVIERGAARALREKLDRGLTVTVDEARDITLLMAAMMTRIPSFRDGLSDSISEELRSVFAQVTANDDSWAGVVERYERDTGKKMPEKYGRDRPNPDAFIIKPKQHFVLGMSLGPLPRIALRLGGMSWTVVEAPRGEHFITSDRPCFLIDPANPHSGFGSGVLGRQAEIIFPLSKERVLIVADGPSGITYGVARDSRTVEMINLRVMIYAWDYIVSPSKSFSGDVHLERLNKRAEERQS